MTTQPTKQQLDDATISLIYALRDSLTDNSPSRLDFWMGRATTAIDTAAAGADSASHMVTIACRKLQIDVLTTEASKRVVTAAKTIDADYPTWQRHIQQNLVYIVALAKIDNTAKKQARKAKQQEQEIPF